MLLPRGITGFHRHDERLSTVADLAAFRGHCHEAARRVSGWVVSFTDPDSSSDYRNYVLGILVLPAGKIAVLLNLHHPFVAFADPLAEASVLLRFRDCPVLADAFGSFGIYEVVPAAQLEEPPTSVMLRELADIERKQVAYWKPRRIGDVVFNWWD
jgi:hypothetical protein